MAFVRNRNQVFRLIHEGKNLSQSQIQSAQTTPTMKSSCFAVCLIKLQTWIYSGIFLFHLQIMEVFAAKQVQKISVDFSQTAGSFRLLHGINKGPLVGGGLIDLTEEQRSLGIPHNRLHDCHWPNPDVVDIHAIFPNPNADSEDPANYDFRMTDEYMAATRATGAEIIFRLGESIDHGTIKRFVHPPASAEKWSAICTGIIRHYNEGWARGFRYGIKYWEIWNEPENRPVMWSGSDEDYLKLYAVSSRTIKKMFPGLKIGGPGVGSLGRLQNGQFVPTAFVTNFLAHCQTNQLPLDFFSWHCYTDRAREFVERAQGVREMLNSFGFQRTESHLNEWNYLPDNSWNGLSRKAPARERQKFYDKMSGSRAAAFVLSSLLQFQQAPIDVANFFHGEVGGFGLFNENGLRMKPFYAFQAFNNLARHFKPVATGPQGRSLVITAGVHTNDNLAVILVCNDQPEEKQVLFEIQNFPWSGATVQNIEILDATGDWEPLKNQEGSVQRQIAKFTIPPTSSLRIFFSPRKQLVP